MVATVRGAVQFKKRSGSPCIFLRSIRLGAQGLKCFGADSPVQVERHPVESTDRIVPRTRASLRCRAAVRRATRRIGVRSLVHRESPTLKCCQVSIQLRRLRLERARAGSQEAAGHRGDALRTERERRLRLPEQCVSEDSRAYHRSAPVLGAVSVKSGACDSDSGLCVANGQFLFESRHPVLGRAHCIRKCARRLTECSHGHRPYSEQTFFFMAGCAEQSSLFPPG